MLKATDKLKKERLVTMWNLIRTAEAKLSNRSE